MSRLLRSCASLLPLLLCLLAARPAMAANDVATVNGHLKRAEANLELVDGSIGQRTSPPKGSAAKLARLRLDQAKADLDPAGTLLAGLKSGAGLAEARARYDKAKALYERLDGILTGTPEPAPQPQPTPQPDPKPTPEPNPKPTPTPQPDPAPRPAAEPPRETVKLGYPHADNFKSALFNLRRVEGDASQLARLVTELSPVPDQLSVDHRTTAGALATLTETRRQAGFVDDGLARIPANGEGVAEAKARLAAVRSSLDSSEAYFQPLHAQLLELIDPARYPAYQEDLRRLSDLSQTYANPMLQFQEQRERAAEAIAQSEAARAECARIAGAYGRLVQQRTDQGVRIEGAVRSFERSHEAFLAMAAQQREALPADIRADMAEANRLADEAVQNQRPMWFTGGIPQRMGWVEDKLALYRALDPEGSAALAAEVEALKAGLRERADSLRELIIQQNTLPADRFTGGDRDAAIAVARDAWGIQQPGFELLAVRIPAEAWARETKWTYSNGTWYFSDRSKLQVRLVVADPTNPELAIDRPVTVIKDHQKGDSMIGVPLRSIDEALEPGEYLLRSKVK